MSQTFCIRSKPDINYVLEAGDVLYVAGELDSVEFIGEEYALGLVTQETERLADDLQGGGEGRSCLCLAC